MGRSPVSPQTYGFTSQTTMHHDTIYTVIPVEHVHCVHLCEFMDFLIMGVESKCFTASRNLVVLLKCQGSKYVYISNYLC